MSPGDSYHLANRINSILKLLSSASQQLGRPRFVRSPWDPASAKLHASVRAVDCGQGDPDVIHLAVEHLKVRKRADSQAREI